MLMTETTRTAAGRESIHGCPPGRLAVQPAIALSTSPTRSRRRFHFQTQTFGAQQRLFCSAPHDDNLSPRHIIADNRDKPAFVSHRERHAFAQPGPQAPIRIVTACASADSQWQIATGQLGKNPGDDPLVQQHR